MKWISIVVTSFLASQVAWGAGLARIYQDVVTGTQKEKVLANQQVQKAQASLTQQKRNLQKTQKEHSVLEVRIARLERTLVEETEKLQESRRLYQEEKKTLDALISSVARHEKLLDEFVQPYGLAHDRKERTQAEGIRLERIDALWKEQMEQIVKASQVRTVAKRIFDAKGKSERATVQTFGPFAARNEKGRWLQYLPTQKTWQVVSDQPQVGANRVVIDPSLGAILPTWVAKNSWFQKVAPAGVIGILIVVVACIGFGIAAYRWMWLTQRKRRMQKQKDNLLVLRDDNALGRLHLALRDGDTDQEVDARLEAALVRETPVFEKGMGTIAVFAGIPTLLGLLGTVSGMIETFTVMSMNGTQQADLLAGGIAEALLTTEFGLIVAIPMILVHCAIKNRVQQLLEMLEEEAARLFATNSSCGCCGGCGNA